MLIPIIKILFLSQSGITLYILPSPLPSSCLHCNMSHGARTLFKRRPLRNWGSILAICTCCTLTNSNSLNWSTSNFVRPIFTHLPLKVIKGLSIYWEALKRKRPFTAWNLLGYSARSFCAPGCGGWYSAILLCRYSQALSGWMVSHFQVTPEMFDWVQVRAQTLAQLLRDICRAVPETLLGCQLSLNPDQSPSPCHWKPSPRMMLTPPCFTVGMVLYPFGAFLRTEERLQSGHFAIKPRSAECCSDGCPSRSFSHLHTGSLALSQSNHWVLGHLS